MLSLFSSTSAERCWTLKEWERIENRTRSLALQAQSESAAWQITNVETRAVMRAYSTSFFIVSRFLPQDKLEKVEAIYAAVRYPDEIVDTFPLNASERLRRLNDWEQAYEEGLVTTSIQEALIKDVPCFLATFTKVVREAGIPPEYYRAFIDAMRRDVAPRRFETLDDLIENYIYGSAIVVGYFLTYVYGSSSKENFRRAKASAHNLGIALQLTNFLRDVAEDEKRGRLYLPLDILKSEGIEELNLKNPRQHQAISNVLRKLSVIADGHYAQAQAGLSAFAEDCQTAVNACIKVYSRLNERIGKNNQSLIQRESVPMMEKFKLLPASKYWRIPLAYIKR